MKLANSMRNFRVFVHTLLSYMFSILILNHIFIGFDTSYANISNAEKFIVFILPAIIIPIVSLTYLLVSNEINKYKSKGYVSYSLLDIISRNNTLIRKDRHRFIRRPLVTTDAELEYNRQSKIPCDECGKSQASQVTQPNANNVKLKPYYFVE